MKEIFSAFKWKDLISKNILILGFFIFKFRAAVTEKWEKIGVEQENQEKREMQQWDSMEA